MEALKNKLSSRRGASILLALLFLLVCMMAGASVLMAAASNAGKMKSSRDEQQKYFTLSSALNLICDELTGIEYHGRYGYERTPVPHSEQYDDGSIYTWYTWKHTYTRHDGSIRTKGEPFVNASADWQLRNVFPLYSDLEIIFANNFKLPGSMMVPLDDYVFAKRDGDRDDARPERKYSLTVAVNGETDADIKGLKEPVKIEIKLREDGGLLVTAALEKHPEYLMEAFLSASGKPEKLLVLDSHTENGTYETEPVKWTLEYIIRKEKEQPEGAGG